MKEFTWHDRPAKEVLNALHSRANGLTSEEVAERQEQEGKNTLPEKTAKSGWSILVAQFASPFMIILLFAAIVSFVLKEWVDVVVIALAILVNSLLGFFEEYKADRSLQALKAYLPEQAEVRRDGTLLRIQAKNIVVGDILLLRAGDKVTADGRILSAHGFEVSEASLTGESTSIEKDAMSVDASAGIGDRRSMVFAGTQVTAGRAEVVVTAIGVRTELGKISALVEEVKDAATPLQTQLARFARRLGIFLIGLAGLIFLVGLLRGFELVEMFYLSVALAVAAVPEGLVVAVTVVLAIGMQRILKKKALVRKLVAAETLGSVEVICMDKTGTLTTGEMAVAAFVDREGKELTNGQLVPLLARMNDISKEVDAAGKEVLVGNPTAKALHRFLLDEGASQATEPLLAELPFTSEQKFAARLHQTSNGAILSAIGGPDILLPFLHLTDAERQKLIERLNILTHEGFRVLLAAQRMAEPTKKLEQKDLHDLEFVSFIVLQDPLRADSAQTVEAARAAGLFPVMITGDHPETARHIAKQAGMSSEDGMVMTGAELDELSDAALQKRIKKTQVFARVIPEHKLRIIRAWQTKGKSVAMTGDGVNDAPALKAADIGIALGSGTSVAKETSDMVLLDNRFATIVDAIREGRILFDNLRKMVVYLLTGTFSEIILVSGALFLGLPLPLLPAQILWINLITDGLPGVALAFEKGEKGIMNDPPRKKYAPIIDREMKVIILLAGIATDVVLFGLFFFLLRQEIAIEEIRTFVFMALGLSSLMYALAVRTLRGSAFSSNPLKNRMLMLALFIGLGLQFLPMLVPGIRELFHLTLLTPLEWLVVGGLAVLNFMLIELVKWFFNRKHGY